MLCSQKGGWGVLEVTLTLHWTNGTDKLTIGSELLLRIDALVLNGVIGSTEASALRKLIIDSRVSSADDLYDMTFENDAEFLAELRRFLKTSKE